MTGARLFTGLTVGIMATVVALSVSLLVLEPEQSLRWLVALSFFPLLIVMVHWLSRRSTSPRITPKMIRGIRTGIVGGGVLLATALVTAIAENLGLMGKENTSNGSSLMLILPAVVAVAIDLFAARLEKKAAEN